MYDLPTEAGTRFLLTGSGHFDGISGRIQSHDLIGSNKHPMVLLALQMGGISHVAGS